MHECDVTAPGFWSGERQDFLMNYLVTGGAGYIGGTVARLLLARGHSVTIYDNLCHSRREALPPGASFVEGDVSDKPLLTETLCRPDRGRRKHEVPPGLFSQ